MSYIINSYNQRSSNISDNINDLLENQTKEYDNFKRIKYINKRKVQLKK